MSSGRLRLLLRVCRHLALGRGPLVPRCAVFLVMDVWLLLCCFPSLCPVMEVLWAGTQPALFSS